jgi:hypothetical protein
MQTDTRPEIRDPRLTPAPAQHTLDTLAAMRFSDLEALYRASRAPDSIRDADGELRGRMLAIKGPGRSPLTAFARRFAASRSFVWDGKTFLSRDDQRGDGHNRVSLPRVLGRQNLFPFTTRIDRSVLDSGATLVLDYDLDVNPGYIRRIHDEIREVSPRLFLGPAMVKSARGPMTVLWFALDGRAS